MSRLIVHSFTISLDGYGAGPNQSLDAPLGEGGTTDIDNDFAAQGMANIGADGGARILRITRLRSYSRTTHARRWRWKVAPLSTS